MIVGVHRVADETLRLHEYSPKFDPERFAAQEKFFVEDVGFWARSRFGISLPSERTAVFGVSAGGELALALGLRHSERYGAIFSASPGGGYRPPDAMPSRLPHTYLVAVTRELFFLENAARWGERGSVGGRIAGCKCRSSDERAARGPRRRDVAARVSFNDPMGIWPERRDISRRCGEQG